MVPKPNHERRKAAGIDAFTAQKGVARSIQTYKHKKESKLARKASLLRGYHKIMKKEGLLDEDGRGGRLRGKRMQPNKRNDISSETTTPSTTATTTQGTQVPKHPVDHDDVNQQRDVAAMDNDARKEEKEQSSQPLLKKRKPKMNPWTKSLQKANEKKAADEQERLRKQQELANRAKKISQRKRDSKLLTQRTKKGQPIMKNIIGNLLSRIEQREQTPDT